MHFGDSSLPSPAAGLHPLNIIGSRLCEGFTSMESSNGLVGSPTFFPMSHQKRLSFLAFKKKQNWSYFMQLLNVFAHFVTRKSRQKPAPMAATRRLFLRQRHRRHLLRGGFGLSWRLGLWNLLVACASGSKLGFLHISNPTSRGSR